MRWPRDVAGHQQQGVGPDERFLHGRRVAEVDGGGAYPLAREFGKAVGIAAGGHDLIRGYTPGQQGFDHETAELAGGSGNDDRHGRSFRWVALSAGGARLRRSARPTCEVLLSFPFAGTHFG